RIRTPTSPGVLRRLQAPERRHHGVREDPVVELALDFDAGVGRLRCRKAGHHLVQHRVPGLDVRGRAVFVRRRRRPVEPPGALPAPVRGTRSLRARRLRLRGLDPVRLRRLRTRPSGCYRRADHHRAENTATAYPTRGPSRHRVPPPRPETAPHLPWMREVGSTEKRPALRAASFQILEPQVPPLTRPGLSNCRLRRKSDLAPGKWTRRNVSPAV